MSERVSEGPRSKTSSTRRGAKRNSAAGMPSPVVGIEAVLRRYSEELMLLPGVVMVGQGQDEAGRDAVAIGVKTNSDLAGLPKEVGGFPIQAMVIGEVDAL